MSPQPIHLLCIVGTSPAIVTETIFALCVCPEDAEPVLLAGLKLITTTQGALGLRRALPEALRQLRADYPEAADRLPPELLERHIVVPLCHDNTPLDDVSTAEESAAMGAAIIEAVRLWTQEGQPALHASVAGGRKTMGNYLGQAMSLYARAEDRMSHVLASSNAERCRDFFYPSPTPRTFSHQGGNFNGAEERINLYEIPFLRLRPHLRGQDLGAGDPLAIFRRAQEALTPPSLCIDLERRELRLNDRALALPPHPATLFILLALARRSGASFNGYDLAYGASTQGKLKSLIYKHFHPNHDVEHNLAPSYSEEEQRELKLLRATLSKLRTQLRAQVPETLMPSLNPRAVEVKGVYSLELNPDQIQVIGLETSNLYNALRDAGFA